MTSNTKPLDIRGRLLGGNGRALVCTPLVGHTTAALKAELAAILPKAPDLVEWRVNFFDAIADQDEVLAAAAQLRALAGGIPLVFTRRAVHEGGEPIRVDEDTVVELYAALCIAKLAVMPRSQPDVLRLLDTTLQASAELQIPLITMSMGGLGAVTRMCGWQYGSSVTFAVGQRVSAPGQIPIEALRGAMAALGEAA